MEGLRRDAVLSRLRQAIASATEGLPEGDVLSQDATDQVVAAVRDILEDRLEGNRSVPPQLWKLVLAMARAYPLSLQDSVEGLTKLTQKGYSQDEIAKLWVQQALSDGSLAAFVSKVPQQFQIVSAYLADAVMCDSLGRLELQSLVADLKGVTPPVLSPRVGSGALPEIGGPIHEGLGPGFEGPIHHVEVALSVEDAEQAGCGVPRVVMSIKVHEMAMHGATLGPSPFGDHVRGPDAALDVWEASSANSGAQVAEQGLQASVSPSMPSSGREGPFWRWRRKDPSARARTPEELSKSDPPDPASGEAANLRDSSSGRLGRRGSKKGPGQWGAQAAVIFRPEFWEKIDPRKSDLAARLGARGAGEPVLDKGGSRAEAQGEDGSAFTDKSPVAEEGQSGEDGVEDSRGSIVVGDKGPKHWGAQAAAVFQPGFWAKPGGTPKHHTGRSEKSPVSGLGNDDSLGKQEGQEAGDGMAPDEGRSGEARDGDSSQGEGAVGKSPKHWGTQAAAIFQPEFWGGKRCKSGENGGSKDAVTAGPDGGRTGKDAAESEGGGDGASETGTDAGSVGSGQAGTKGRRKRGQGGQGMQPVAEFFETLQFWKGMSPRNVHGRHRDVLEDLEESLMSSEAAGQAKRDGQQKVAAVEEDFEAKFADARVVVERLKVLSGEVTGLNQADPLGDEDPGVRRLCKAVMATLSFGLRPRPTAAVRQPNVGKRLMKEIGKIIPMHQPTAFALLRNIQRELAGERDMGVEAIEAIASVTRDGMKLWLWIRSSLNAQSLGWRIAAVVEMEGAVDGWCEEWAPLRHKELSKDVVEALKALDVLKFLLSVDDGVLQAQWGDVRQGGRLTSGRVQGEIGQEEGVAMELGASGRTMAHSLSSGSDWRSDSGGPISASGSGSGLGHSRSRRTKNRIVNFGTASRPLPARGMPTGPLDASLDDRSSTTGALSPVSSDLMDGAEPLSQEALAQTLGLDMTSSAWADDESILDPRNLQLSSRSKGDGQGRDFDIWSDPQEAGSPRDDAVLASVEVEPEAATGGEVDWEAATANGDDVGASTARVDDGEASAARGDDGEAETMPERDVDMGASGQEGIPADSELEEPRPLSRECAGVGGGNEQQPQVSLETDLHCNTEALGQPSELLVGLQPLQQDPKPSLGVQPVCTDENADESCGGRGSLDTSASKAISGEEGMIGKALPSSDQTLASRGAADELLDNAPAMKESDADGDRQMQSLPEDSWKDGEGMIEGSGFAASCLFSSRAAATAGDSEQRASGGYSGDGESERAGVGGTGLEAPEVTTRGGLIGSVPAQSPSDVKEAENELGEAAATKSDGVAIVGLDVDSDGGGSPTERDEQDVQDEQSATTTELCSGGPDVDEDLLEEMDEVLGEGQYMDQMAAGMHSRASSLSESSCHVEAGWRDVDVVSVETDVDSSGEQYHSYTIEVTASDGTSWQVSKRFRDFVALCSSLKKMDGVRLPQSWANVSKARHVTGATRFSPEVVQARLALIRQCLWDLRSQHPDALSWDPVALFLDPPLYLLRGLRVRGRDESDTSGEGTSTAPDLTMEYGSTVRLQLQLLPKRSDADLFDMQKGVCPGCRSALPPAPPPKSSSLASLLWPSSSSPRRCHYTNLLYCHRCHAGNSAIVPARVLHKWDFAPRPVCVVAGDYLASIYPRPVLCVGAVNPGLFARVPSLARAHAMRQKLVRSLEVVKSSGPRGAEMVEALMHKSGPYAHLLETPDFWSLRDLVEISRGAFAELPRWLEKTSRRVGRMATEAVLTSECTAAHNP